MALSKGSSGDAVEKLQQTLIEQGYLAEGEDDGQFGSKTEAAVKAYQAEMGLDADGIVGSKTQASLDSSSGVSSNVTAGITTTSSPSSAVDVSGAVNADGTYDMSLGPYYQTLGYTPVDYGTSSGSTSSASKATSKEAAKTEFSTSEATDDYKYLLDYYLDDQTYGTYTESDAVKALAEELAKAEAANPGSYEESEAVTAAKAKLAEIEANKPADYQESAAVTAAKAKLAEIESGKPADYTSKYDEQIAAILDTINNRGSFDVSTDTNYNKLYDLYKQNYQVQADKAMRDTMGSAQAATGGYGSTYSQMVGQQAYDNTMQSLNDQSYNLMNLAYNMYSDDRANDYNKLSAYQSLDNTDYSRYRDTVNDWQTDRSYYATQADNAATTDYNRYRDTVNDWQTDRSYYANRADTEYANDYNQYRDKVSDYNTERSYAYDKYNNERNYDYSQYQDRVNNYNTDRAFWADMYNNSYANDLAKYEFDADYNSNYENNLYERALQFASQGYEVPASYKNMLTDDEIATINSIAAEQKAAQTATPASTQTKDNSDQGTVSKYGYYELLDNASDEGDTKATEELRDELIKIYGDDAYTYYLTSRGLRS